MLLTHVVPIIAYVAINAALAASAGGGVIAVNEGINLNGYILHEANGVSDDSQLISGNAYREGGGNLGYVFQIAAGFRRVVVGALALISNTTPATPATATATATRDVQSWSVIAQPGYGFDVDVTRISLVAGVRHTSAKFNAFTETGGPSPLTGLARTCNAPAFMTGRSAAGHAAMPQRQG